MLRQAVIFLCIVLFTGSLLAGVVYEVEVKNHDDKPDKTEQIKVFSEGRNIKMTIVSRGSGESDAIFRGDRKEMLILDHESKSYVLMDRETIESMAGQISAAMSQMDEALKNVPEGQRAMLEKMMKDKLPQATAVPERSADKLVKIGDSETVNGYPTVKYQVVREGKVLREFRVTDWDNVEGGKDVAQTFKEMGEFFKEMLDAFASSSGMSGLFTRQFEEASFTYMHELEGFPVVSREFADNGSVESEAALRSVNRQTIDSSVFEPPAGYKRQEISDRKQ